jgi:hypothetical protein
MEGIWNFRVTTSWINLPNNRWIYCNGVSILEDWPVDVGYKRLGPKQLTEWEE